LKNSRRNDFAIQRERVRDFEYKNHLYIDIEKYSFRCLICFSLIGRSLLQVDFWSRRSEGPSSRPIENQVKLF